MSQHVGIHFLFNTGFAIVISDTFLVVFKTTEWFLMILYRDFLQQIFKTARFLIVRKKKDIIVNIQSDFSSILFISSFMYFLRSAISLSASNKIIILAFSAAFTLFVIYLTKPL